MRVYGLLQLAVQLPTAAAVRLDEGPVHVLGPDERLPLLPAEKLEQSSFEYNYFTYSLSNGTGLFGGGGTGLFVVGGITGLFVGWGGNRVILGGGGDKRFVREGGERGQIQVITLLRPDLNLIRIRNTADSVG